MKYLKILLLFIFLIPRTLLADGNSDYSNSMNGIYKGINSSFDLLNNLFFSTTEVTLSEYIANYMLSMISNMFFVLVLIVAVVNIYTWLTQGGQQFFNLFMNTLFATILTFFMFYLTGSKSIQLEDSNKTYKSYLVVEAITSLFYVSERFADFLTYNLLFGSKMNTYSSPKLWETSIKSGPTGEEKLDGFVFTYLISYVKNSHKRVIDEITKNTNEENVANDMKGSVVKNTQNLKDKVQDIASPANIKYMDDLSKNNIALLLPYATFNINMSQPLITPTTSKYNYSYNIYDPNTQEILAISKDVEITHAENGLYDLKISELFNQDDNLKKLFVNSNNQMTQAINVNVDYLNEVKSKYVTNAIKTTGQQSKYNELGNQIDELTSKFEYTKQNFNNEVKNLMDKKLDDNGKEFNTLKDTILANYSESLLGFSRNKFNDPQYINDVTKNSQYGLINISQKTVGALLKQSVLNDNRTYALELDALGSIYGCYHTNVLEKIKQYGGMVTLDSGNMNLEKKCKEPLEAKLNQTVQSLNEVITKIDNEKFGGNTSGGGMTLNQVFSKSLFNQKNITLGDKFYFHWTDLGMFYTGIKSGMGTVTSIYNIALKNSLNNEQTINVFNGVNALSKTQADSIIKQTAEKQISNIAWGSASIAGIATSLTQLGGVFQGVSSLSTSGSLFASSVDGAKGLAIASGKLVILSAASFALTFLTIYIALSIVYYALPAVFWFMGVINWFIKCSILTALMPISIILFLFNGKRQQFFNNVYLLFGQALVPIVLVTLFFVVANSSLIIDIVAQEMIPIFNTKLMIKVGMEILGFDSDFQKAIESVGSMDDAAEAAQMQSMINGMIGGATAGAAGAAILTALGVASGGVIPLLMLGIGAITFGSALGGLMGISAEDYVWQVIRLLSYVIESFYFLFCIFMNLFLFRFFWQADRFVNEIIGVQVSNDMMNPDKALQSFGMARFAAG